MFNCSNAWMFKCSNIHMFKCSNVSMFQCSNDQIFQSLESLESNVQIIKYSKTKMFECLNVKCHMSNVIYQTSNVEMLNFCRSVPQKFLRAFLTKWYYYWYCVSKIGKAEVTSKYCARDQIPEAFWAPLAWGYTYTIPM